MATSSAAAYPVATSSAAAYPVATSSTAAYPVATSSAAAYPAATSSAAAYPAAMPTIQSEVKSAPSQNPDDELLVDILAKCEFLARDRDSLEASLRLMAEDMSKDKKLIKELTRENQSLRQMNASLLQGMPDSASAGNNDVSTEPRSIPDRPAGSTHSNDTALEDPDDTSDFILVSRRKQPSSQPATRISRPHPPSYNEAISGLRSYSDAVKHIPVITRCVPGPLKPVNAQESVETVVVGTSLVDGLGLALNKLGSKVTCYRYGGADLERIRANIPNILPANRYRDKRVRCVVQGGGNDACSVPVSTVISRYDHLINDIRKQCSHVDIITSRIPPRRNSLDPKATQETIYKIEQINTYLRTRSMIKGDISFVDACPKDPDLLDKGLVHFNDYGKQSYADKVHAYLLDFPLTTSENLT